jgi:hypothetical protein
MNNATIKYWREDDDALAVSVDGVVTYQYDSIFEAVEDLGVSIDDVERLV